MGNTNFQTIHQMSTAISDLVKQATGRDNVQNIDMEHVTVAQNHRYEDVDLSGQVVSFQAGEAGIPLEKLVVHVDPVQEGTGDPSPDNVRPITGWTGAKVTRTGKNLLRLVESEMISSGWNRLFPINVKAGAYTISCQNKFGVGSTYGASIFLADENYNAIGNYLTPYTFGDSEMSRSVTITEEQAKAKYILFSIRASGGTFANINDGNIQLELGSTATAYEPYQGETYDITFPSEAGTVYGGTLDVITGELVVDKANIASYNGETLPGEWISDRDVYAEGTTPTIGSQVVYQLSTTLTYHLTQQEITTLFGLNTIWADTGDIDVKYKELKEMY